MKHKLNYSNRFKPVLYLWMVLWIAMFNLSPFQVIGNSDYLNDQNDKTVKGRVILPDGSPAFEVTVMVKETLYSALTDEKGQFSVSTTAPNPTLIFSQQDYETREITVEGNDELLVTLVPV